MQPGFNPAPGCQARKAATPTRGSSASSMLKSHPQPLSGARQTPRTADSDGRELAAPVGARPTKPSQPINVQAGLRRSSPVSSAGAHKSPVSLERMGGDSVVRKRVEGGKPRLTQGNLTSARSSSVCGFPVTHSAGATPRSQLLDMQGGTPRAGPAHPIVVVNPCFEVSVRHQGGASLNKSGGAAILDYKLPDDGVLGEPSGLQGRRVLGPGRDATRKSVSSSPVLGVNNAAPTALDSSRQRAAAASASLDSAWASQVQWTPDVEQRTSLQTAISLLQQNEILQQDAVLKDLLQLCVSRLTSSQLRRDRGAAHARRVVVTSDSATQVVTVEACTQTEIPEFKEKRMRPKRRGERGNGSYSDSDVPSSDNTAEGRQEGGWRRRRQGGRRNSLDESVSLSTNSPRESVDGYSRDLSDASGPISVASQVQLSVASSTDASQTATLPHDVPPLDGIVGSKPRGGGGRGGGKNAGLQGADAGEGAEGGRQSVVPSGEGGGGQWAGSPSPSIETLMELQRILDEQYKKLLQTGVPPPMARGAPGRFDGLSSPATAEMRRLTMESALSLLLEDAAPRISPPDRPPNPDPTKRSPSAQLSPQGLQAQRWLEALEEGAHPHIPRSVRMGNSPPKEVQKPTKQLHSVPTLNLPRPRHAEGSVESPLSTPRSGSAFLAHVNSGPPSTNSGSAHSTPRAPYRPVTGITVKVGANGQPGLSSRRM